MFWNWLFGGGTSKPLFYELGINRSIQQIDELPELNDFSMTINVTDSIKLTYDPSIYTRTQYNEYATRVCKNRLQIFGTAYVATEMEKDDLLQVITSYPAISVREFIGESEN